MLPLVTFNSIVRKCPEVLQTNRSGVPSRLEFSSRISENDLKTKINMVQKFLKQGDNVLVKVILKGRESVKYDLGSKRMESILSSLKESYKNTSGIKSEKSAIQCTLFP